MLKKIIIVNICVLLKYHNLEKGVSLTLHYKMSYIIYISRILLLYNQFVFFKLIQFYFFFFIIKSSLV